MGSEGGDGYGLEPCSPPKVLPNRPLPGVEETAGMNPLMRGMASSLGSKLVVALTGAGLIGFVIAHMAGNLQMFIGQDAVNAYAAQLKSMPELLWVMRIGLIGVAAAHVVTAVRLAASNKAARPVAYHAAGSIQQTTSARTMVLTGLLVLAFVVYHLAHFTWGLVHADAFSLVDAQGRHDVFSMTVLGFQQPIVAGAYLLAMLLLALHLLHGAASLFQTWGVTNQAWAPLFKTAAKGLAWVILIGNASMPIAVQLGLIVPPAGVGS